MGPRVAPRVCAHCRRHRQCWRRVRRCLTLEAGGRARSNGNRYVVPWRVRDVRPLRLRRRAGRPQLKRDPLGCTQKFLIPSRSPTTVVPAGTLARYALALQCLAATHRLGLVANILSPTGLWLDEFARAGVLNLFATLVFSSDSSSIKPSRKLFDQALSGLEAPRTAVVFVGDSLRCDIGGAAAAGLATVWIDRTGRGRQAGEPEPTFVIRDLLELVDTHAADG